MFSRVSSAKPCTDGRAQPDAQPHDEPTRTAPRLTDSLSCFHLSFWTTRTGPLGEPHFTSQQVAVAAVAGGTSIIITCRASEVYTDPVPLRAHLGECYIDLDVPQRLQWGQDAESLQLAAFSAQAPDARRGGTSYGAQKHQAAAVKKTTPMLHFP